MSNKKLGEAIRELRERCDFSLRELAKKLDVSAPFLSDVELSRRYPSDEVLAKMAKALGVSVDDLKQYDHRESVSDLKKLIEGNPGLGFAFRTAVENVKDGKMTSDQLAELLKRGTKG